jgi:hypothetical protein
MASSINVLAAEQLSIQCVVYLLEPDGDVCVIIALIRAIHRGTTRIISSLTTRLLCLRELVLN